ncbi:MAG TPA: hypothetical protein VEI73_06335 [Candidatus Acidoferrum sp.]|nr:hypothetical protein [Candidatus Acidoferrum sp.]
MKQERITKAVGRMWHGVASKQHLPLILEHLSETRLRGSLDAKGNLGGVLLSRESNGAAEVYILTLWESEQAIRGFVGDNIHAPAYQPGDEEYVVGREPTVRYFDAEILKLQESTPAAEESVSRPNPSS